MPIISANISANMMAKASSLALAGRDLSKISSSIATAVATYVPAASFVTSTNNVTGPGAGTFTGTLKNVNASAMQGLMMAQASLKGLAGRDITKMLQAASNGVVQGLKTAIVQGAVIGGGPGTGKGKVLNLVPSALQGAIMAQFSLRGIAGRDSAKLASVVAFGVCNHILSVSITSQSCIGAFAGPPAGPIQIPAAVGTGKLI